MDFGLSEEQEMLQDTVRSFIDGECPTTRLREIFDRGDGFDPALWKGLVEMGLVGLAIDEEHGGGGLELLDLALVQEVIGERGLPGPFMSHALAAHAVSIAGDAAQKKRWLPSMVEGELATIALCEGPDGWMPAAWRTRREGDRLSGVKTYVPHAAVARRFVVGLEGGELALVEADAPGVHLEAVDGLDRSRPMHRVSFDATPCEALAEAGEVADRVVDAGLCLLAADAFGAASHLVDITVAYAQTREQFGQKIAEFQSVKHQLARLGTDIEPTRALYWYAAHAFDHIAPDRARSAALAKAHITDRAVAAGRMCVELHGGLGFTWECDVQIWLKRCLFDRAFLGTPSALRARCADLAGW
jgi:alkylation response protein AidB-like acyl-CoA dehydrogenase